MKKTLFMGALALTIATSMVAGTMAIYTHADTLTAGDENTVTAKRFYISSKAVSEKIDIKLAPTEKAKWDFTTRNYIDTSNKEGTVSEVDQDMIIDIAFTNDASAKVLPDITCDLLDASGNVIAKGVRDAQTGAIKITEENFFKKETPKEGTFSLQFEWVDPGTQDDKADTAAAMKANPDQIKGITVTVTGKQHVDTPAV